jgi:hypothetical protein
MEEKNMLKDTWVDKKDGVDINSAEDINQVAHAVIDLENDGGSGVHIGSEAPEDGSDVWIDTDEQPEIGEPDWAANEGDAGHIKNRTHYVDTFGKVHKLDNKFINSEWMATKKQSGGAPVVDETTYTFSGKTLLLATIQKGFKINVGLEYDVYWKGEVYPCTAFEHSGELFLGNADIMSSVTSPYSNPDAPFLFSGYSDTINMVTKASATSEALTVKITTHAEIVYNKLPKEYLPDDIGGSIDVTASVGQTIIVKEVDENGKPTKWEATDLPMGGGTNLTEQTMLIEQKTFTGSYNSTFGCYDYGFYGTTLKEGKEYTVIFDGVEYVRTAKTFSLQGMTGVYIGNEVLLGNNTGEPFCLAFVYENSGGIMALLFDNNEHTMSVSCENIKGDYLSNAFPYYIDIVGKGTESNPYVCNETVEHLEQIWASGRTIAVRHKNFNGVLLINEEIYHFTTRVFLTEHGYTYCFIGALYDLNSPLCRFALIPQSDGTYIAELQDLD